MTDDRPPHEILAEQILAELEAAHAGKYPSMEVDAVRPTKNWIGFYSAFGDDCLPDRPPAPGGEVQPRAAPRPRRGTGC